MSNEITTEEKLSTPHYRTCLKLLLGEIEAACKVHDGANALHFVHAYQALLCAHIPFTPFGYGKPAGLDSGIALDKGAS